MSELNLVGSINKTKNPFLNFSAKSKNIVHNILSLLFKREKIIIFNFFLLTKTTNKSNIIFFLIGIAKISLPKTLSKFNLFSLCR
jgi:hypothetical protein